MSDTESKPAQIRTESVSEKPRKKGIAGHCAKRWWMYLLGVCILVAVLIPIIILVAVPKIAQKKLDEAELTLESIVMTNSQPAQFKMSIDSVIRTDGKVHAKIEPFTGVMYLPEGENTPFAALNFPETTSDAFQVVNVTQETKIEDLEAFTEFNKQLLASTEFQVAVKGDTGIHVKGISKRYPATFQKTLTLKGLQTFAGLEVFNTTFSLFPDKNDTEHINFRGWVRIPNRSIVSFEVGNATFDTFLLGKKVGTTYLDNLTLVPGNDNVFPMRCSIDQLSVLNVVSMKPYCDVTKGVVPFELVGTNVTNNGQYLKYFADALAAGTQKVDIDLFTPLKKAHIEVECAKE